jgi:hypothetical protein
VRLCPNNTTVLRFFVKLPAPQVALYFGFKLNKEESQT